MEKLRMYSLTEAEDITFGKAGTPKREAYEEEKRIAMEADRLAIIVREAREREKLTQAQLAELADVPRRQISHMENGKDVFLSAVSRVLHALKLKPITYDGLVIQ